MFTHFCNKWALPSFITLFSLLFAGAVSAASNCVDCHRQVTPNAVVDWELSKHSKASVDCAVCHGNKHTNAKDAAQAKMPSPDTCGQCHAERVAQYKASKHAAAWVAMNAMPTIHYQPMAMIEGQKGCGSCHRVGLKTDAEKETLRKQGNGYGSAACDSCHTRHTFSVAEAKQPQACQTCHTGFDHPQWEMYSGSKHGVRYGLKQLGILQPTAAAPTCQTCHMQNGDHNVQTSWGFLAVRLPLPEDKVWAADRATILQALQVLDPEGKPTARLDLVKAGNVARLTQEDWQKQRDKMVAACSQCHASAFAKGELAKGDDMIREADHLMAEAIRVVTGLYADGTLPKPKGYAYAFPDLLTFHDAPTVIEQKLFVMFLEHRMRAFQGTFHANPDYAMWYGWSEMRRDLTEIQSLAEEMRRAKGTAKK
ncbi:MAG: hypothetical protein LBB65_01440 [Burkholderiales bacterium]|nr:hypothetical protein [Burkholderiales bacterium]